MQKERLFSLDAIRGLTVLLMVIVNNPGSWSYVYPPLLHAEWNGCTPTDLVFPFFIFILGIAIPLAMPNTTFDNHFLLKISTRSLRIINLGLFLNFFNHIYFLNLTGIPLLVFRLVLTVIVGYVLMGNYPQKLKFYSALLLFSVFLFLAFGTTTFAEIRLPGVLQRIGLVYFFASLIYAVCSIRSQIIISLLLLLGYWAAMSLLWVPGFGEANLEKGTNLSAYIDQIILGNHVYAATKPWDPEGLFSSLPTIAHALIGVLVGQIIILSFTKIQRLKYLLYFGLVLTFLGWIWSFVFPWNKSLWTSSFVLYTSGLASLLFALLYYLIDYKGFKKYFNPILIWGVNPMIVFFLSGIIPRALWMIVFPDPKNPTESINLQEYIYQYHIASYFTNPFQASFAAAITFAFIMFGILYFFYKKNLFFKV